MSEPKATDSGPTWREGRDFAIHLVNQGRLRSLRQGGFPAGQRVLPSPAQKFEGGGLNQVGMSPIWLTDGFLRGAGVANAERPVELVGLAKLAEDLPEGTYRFANVDPGPAMFGVDHRAISLQPLSQRRQGARYAHPV